jgi:UPF0755 protein
MLPRKYHRRPIRAVPSLTVFPLLMASAVAVAAVTWYRPSLQPRDPTDLKLRLFHLAKGTSARALTTALQERKLIRSAAAAMVYLTLTGKSHRLKAGYYDLRPAMSTPEIIDTIVGGKIALRRVLVPPGCSLKQVAERVAAAGLGSPSAFLRAAGTDFYAADLPFPLPRGRTVEGYLFPDTYLVAMGTPPEEIIRRMLQAFYHKFVQPQARALANCPFSLHELVTIASLIEREAAVDSERPVIAGVIVNRLRRGMPLQIDATVLYALGHHKPRLFYQDLKVASDYNTYLHRGLPPGPICSPGLASLLAALHPARHDYLFYVACGQGRHRFSRTYEQHLRVIKHLAESGRRPK